MLSEKQKMISGQWYNPADKELSEDRLKVKTLCQEYNSMSFGNEKEKMKFLKKIFGKTSTKLFVEPNFFCDYGYNIEVGKKFYVNHNCVILDCAKVIFGDNVMIGPNCGFYTAIHPLDFKTRNKYLECAKPIIVGNNVWIGGGVTVLPGVTIGDNSVIGAGSVVTKDIPNNVVAVGNPCKPIKEIVQK